MTKEIIIQILKELDAKSEKTVGTSALVQKGVNQYHIRKYVPEGLTQLKQDLGLKISRQERPLSNDELLEQLDKVVSKFKKIPTWAQIERETKTTQKVFNNRFGKKGIRDVFRHYSKWLEKNKSDSENIKLVNEYIENQGRIETPRSHQDKKKDSSSKKPIRTHSKGHGRQYGESLNFRNFIYEPTTEQGVVLLFGKVSECLGFSIEGAYQDWPDCEAKRFIHGAKRRQQSVKIEFEYESYDYKRNHPVKGCDIIVCWKHNWNGCPLEVIELRTEMEKIRKCPEFAED